jgi:uncharacterized membrane protein
MVIGIAGACAVLALASAGLVYQRCFRADAKAKAARTAMLFSRTNLLLSLPMLATMTMNQTLFG